MINSMQFFSKNQSAEKKSIKFNNSFVKEVSSGNLYEVVSNFDGELRMESTRDEVFIIRYIHGQQNWVVPKTDFEPPFRFEVATEYDLVSSYCGDKALNIFQAWEQGHTITYEVNGIRSELPPYSSPRFDSFSAIEYFKNAYLDCANHGFSSSLPAQFSLLPN